MNGSAPIFRRDFVQAGTLGATGLSLFGSAPMARAAAVPDEPLDIGHEPQFVFDQHVVDCTWGLRSKHEPVRRVFHQPKKHPANPLIPGDDQSASWLSVLRDGSDGPFRMWYQCNQPFTGRKGLYRNCIAYAESKDGVRWERPSLDLFPKENPEQTSVPSQRRLVSHAAGPDGAAMRGGRRPADLKFPKTTGAVTATSCFTWSGARR